MVEVEDYRRKEGKRRKMEVEKLESSRLNPLRCFRQTAQLCAGVKSQGELLICVHQRDFMLLGALEK